MAKFYKALYYLFIAALLSIGLLLIGTLFPIPGNYEVKVVLSGSMEPAIKKGSMVVVRPVDLYKTGDVITFGKDDKENIPTTHRIIAERVENGNLLFTTKGDANDDPDGKEVRESEVIGKVVFDIPYLGFILDMARKPIGFVILIVIPAVLVVFDEVIKIWAEIKKMRNKKNERRQE